MRLAALHGSRSPPRISHTREAVVGGESAQNDRADTDRSPRARGKGGSFSSRDLRDRVPAELRDVEFPHAVRGYERAAVDAYVKRVNHLIAELEVSRSPRSAVQHALDRATDEVSAILERAQQAAEEITASARKEADENAARTSVQAGKVLVDANDHAERTRAEADGVLAKAKADAEKMVASAKAEAEEILARARSDGSERLQRSEKEIGVRRELAEARMRDLRADTDIVWEERRELLDEVSALAARITELGREAAARFPAPEPGESREAPQAEHAEPEPGDGASAKASTPAAESGLPRDEASSEDATPASPG
jgi:DivIVA domain-containing protein